MHRIEKAGPLAFSCPASGFEKPVPGCGPALAKHRRGFSLIELMIVLIIMGWILIFALKEYMQHIYDSKIVRAKADLEEIAKAIRLYNIREEKPFKVGTFTYTYLGSFIGTYFEKEPPLDPWGHPYLHCPNLGMVYSTGEDGKDNLTYAYSTDDVVTWYLPQQFFITKAEYVDVNNNNQIDFGDMIEMTFSRPAKMNEVSPFDFVTSHPEKALGSAIVKAPPDGQALQIIFSLPIAPQIKIGETKIRPRKASEALKDFSTPPMSLDDSIEVVIQRRRM